MSTATRRPRRSGFRTTPTAESPPGRRRRRWRLAVVALVPVALLWLLPAIVAHSPLLDWVLDAATADLAGTVEIRSASLGWFSPVVIEGIEVRGADEETVLKAAGLRGDKWLAQILWDPAELGRLRIERPELTVVLRHHGSNVEDLLAAYLQPAEEPEPFAVELELVDGSVLLIDKDSRQSWQVDEIELTLSLSGDDAEALRVETSATIADPQHPGRFTLGLSMGPAPDTSPAEDPSPGTGKLTLQSDAVPLGMFQSLAGRLLPKTQLAGRISCRMDAQWGDPAALGQTVVRAEVTADDLVLAMPPLGTDRVQLEKLHASCQIAVREDRIEIEQSLLDCDLGSVSVTSTLDFGRSQEGSWLASVLSQTHEIEGRIDLARLAGMLPETLRIRKGTQITSGHLQLALRSIADSRGMVWQGLIETGDLTAVDGQRRLAWRTPIRITLAAHDYHQGPVVDALQCESDFLQLHAAGTADELTASASFSLRQLAEQLGQFVDLGGIGLGGDGWAQFQWKRSEQRLFETSFELQLRGFQLAMPENESWTEENLQMSFSANGQTDFGADTQLQAASLDVRAGTDHFVARLSQPVLDFSGGGSWPVELNASGQLQHWPVRLQHWITPADCRVAGDYDLVVRGTGSKDGCSLRRARITVRQFQLQTSRLNVAEPAIELVTSGQWDQKQRRLNLNLATLGCNSLSVQANQLVLAVPEEGPIELSGTLKYQADLQRLSQWIADPAAAGAWQIQGQLAGTSQLAHTAGVVQGQVEADVDNLRIAFSSGEQFHEPAIHLSARGSYGHRPGMLQLEQFELSSPTLGVEAAGHVSSAEGPSDVQLDVQLDGQVRYDLEKLVGLLGPSIGPGIRFVGSGVGPVSYHGPLTPAKARVQAVVGWESADVHGFSIGPGELKATLAGGIVRIDPLDVSLGSASGKEGRLRLAPQLRIAPGPVQLTLAPGPLASQVKITPPMCASALKYIAPVLAGVTTAQGAFSIELEGCRIPLADPGKGDVAGRLTIHSVQVGPGPLVRELAVLLGRESPARLRRESVIPFRMVDGRVHHAGLELEFPDLTIRTSGSVGLDQTLDLVAEMPVPPKWLGNNPLGAALRNQTIRLPIGGTLFRPAVDRRRIEQLSRQFLERGARNAIENEVGKQLERLFGPPR